ncbi:MAG TPA: glycine betaine ABC transporter substrate-binding protein [Ktedonobacterales bacterium]|nr:glycine betaine ABC transporter substrate-binding protein [Ktedonobacterales bacterium]
MRPSPLVKALLIVPLALLALAGCGPSTGGSASSPCKGTKVTVGGKLDTEAQLLTEMYSLLLKNAGCTVTERAKLGTNQIVFNAITSGQIDLYPEFTATGLAQLGESTTHNAQQDYQMVKQGYEQKYQITWLDAAPMNDTYGVCTTKSNATSLNVSKVSDLVPLASKDTLATPPDGQSDPNVIPALQKVYGIKFGTETVLDENLTFQAVQQGNAQFNICYTTNGLISADNFVLLDDDKSVFPIYNPAPIVRDSTLKNAPAIADALNPLAPKLTTAEITKLNADVDVNHQTVHEVAQTWLKQQGLLP